MGIPDSDFVDAAAISDVLKCPVCFEVFDDPVFGSTDDQCQHAFCRHCIEQSLEQSEQCPTCRAEVHLDDLRSHWVLRNLLDELPYRCQRRCGWTGRRDAHAAHREVCPVLRAERMEAAMAKREHELAAREARVTAFEREIRAQTQRIADLEAQTQRLDRDLINVGGQLLDREVRISDLEALAREREGQLREACELLAMRDAEVAQLTNLVESLTDAAEPPANRQARTPTVLTAEEVAQAKLREAKAASRPTSAATRRTEELAEGSAQLRRLQTPVPSQRQIEDMMTGSNDLEM